MSENHAGMLPNFIASSKKKKSQFLIEVFAFQDVTVVCLREYSDKNLLQLFINGS